MLRGERVASGWVIALTARCRDRLVNSIEGLSARRCALAQERFFLVQTT
ncbi:hypothetical protein BXY51_004599 [Actinoplanes cyaneus]|nr:hypothetical protein [Actinoplanes cyaneus]